MKKIFTKSIIVLSVLFGFLSCQSGVADKKVLVNFSFTGIEEEIEDEEVFRSILPNTGTIMDFTDLKLEGKLSGGETKEIRSWKTYAEMRDDVEPIELDEGSWYFTLSGKRYGTTFKESVYETIASYSENIIEFKKLIVKGDEQLAAYELHISIPMNKADEAVLVKVQVSEDDINESIVPVCKSDTDWIDLGNGGMRGQDYYWCEATFSNSEVSTKLSSHRRVRVFAEDEDGNIILDLYTFVKLKPGYKSSGNVGSKKVNYQL